MVMIPCGPSRLDLTMADTIWFLSILVWGCASTGHLGWLFYPQHMASSLTWKMAAPPCNHGTEVTQRSTLSKGMIQMLCTQFLFTFYHTECRHVVPPRYRDWEKQALFLVAMSLGFPGPMGLVSKGTMV